MKKNYFLSKSRNLFLFLILIFMVVQTAKAIDPPMSGTYTIIKGGGGDYLTFNAAITDLTARGVSGHCIFNVGNGTYNEQVVIPAIIGSGESANIMFASASGNPDDVILTYNVSDPLANYILKLDGADYVIIQDITFQVGDNTSYGVLINLENGADNNAIMNNKFIGHPTISKSASYALICSQYGNSVDEMNLIFGNEFKNGSYGVYLASTDNSNLEKGNTIYNNKFTDAFNGGVYMYFQDSCIVRGDSILNSTSSHTTTPYGVYLNACKKEYVYNNHIIMQTGSGDDGSNGIYIEDGLGDLDNRGYIANNFISLYINNTKSTLGITLRNSSYRDVIYNSVNITGAYNASVAFKVWGTSDWYVAQNNIFANQAEGYAIYSDISSNFASDYNNLYSNGKDLVQHVATSCSNLVDYQTATTKDENSLSVDPEFVSDTDLHIYHANENLDGAGLAIVGTTKDFDNNTRDETNPDIGADEYTYINDEKEILTFSITEQTGAAVINSESHTISLEVEYGSDLTSLVATFTISENASVKIGTTDQVSGVTENDFSSPVIYVVTAEDNTTQNWTVTVTEALNDENDILTFSFTEQTGVAIISDVNHTVDIEVDFGTDLTNLIASFTLSPDANAKIGETNQVSGVTANNFTNPVVYRIFAENGTEQEWTINVSIGPNIENDILTFSFPEQNGEATINATNHTVEVELVPGSSLADLVATFTLSENAEAYIGDIVQTSGTTANDYSSDVVYTIVAEDESEQDWTVSVTVEPYHGTDILTFSFTEQTGVATINATTHSIDVELTEGTNVTNLIATYTLSEGATANVEGGVQTSGVTENDFTNPVTYTVIAEDQTEQDWTVNVTVEDNSTGIEDMESLGFMLYPNPTTNYINIVSNSIQNGLVELEVFDIAGTAVVSKEIFLNSKLNVTINFDQDINSGIYFLRLKTSEKIVSKRFLVK